MQGKQPSYSLLEISHPICPILFQTIQPVPWQLKFQKFSYQLRKLHKVFVTLCGDELFEEDRSQMLYPE